MRLRGNSVAGCHSVACSTIEEPRMQIICNKTAHMVEGSPAGVDLLTKENKVEYSGVLTYKVNSFCDGARNSNYSYVKSISPIEIN